MEIKLFQAFIHTCKHSRHAWVGIFKRPEPTTSLFRLVGVTQRIMGNFTYWGRLENKYEVNNTQAESNST